MAEATKSVLFVWGGWEGHQPRETVELFAHLLESEGYRVMFSDDLETYCSPDLAAKFDLICQNWTMGQISTNQLSGLINAVGSGVGFAGWHGGMGDAFRGSPEFQFLVGGQFVAHPGGIKEFTVDITDAMDPITHGISSFTMVSEQYYLHVDPSNQILATTIFHDETYPWVNGTRIPVVWKRRWGSGRVFYCSLGHTIQDFDVFEAREIIRRGLMWASR